MKHQVRKALVRDAADGDMGAVQAIYAEHVRTGLASFEDAPPDVDEMARRRAAVLELGLPYRVADYEGTVKGFAYAGPYRHRPAYRYSLENSVYVASDALRLGLGRLLLADLIERCTALGYRQMVAIIGDSQNQASINLHARLGFQTTGALTSVGFKFGRWVDSVIMQRPLGDGGRTLPAG